MAKIGVLVDKSTVFTEGLIAAIHQLGHINVVISSSEMDQCKFKNIDLLIIDLDVHHTLLQEISATYTRKIEGLVFSSAFDKEKVDFILSCHVKGILPKDVSIKILSDCFISLLNKEAYIHPSLSKYLISSYVHERFVKEKPCMDNPLSNREREILSQIVQGRTDKEIGEALSISHTTVRNHVKNVYKKTKAKNRIQLLLLCMERRWIPFIKGIEDKENR